MAYFRLADGTSTYLIISLTASEAWLPKDGKRLLARRSWDICLVPPERRCPDQALIWLAVSQASIPVYSSHTPAYNLLRNCDVAWHAFG